MIKRECDGCRKESDESEQMTCLTAEIDLHEFGVNENGCFDDAFYCKDCLNEHDICKNCSEKIPQDAQSRIAKYVDTRDNKYKNSIK